MEPNQNKPQKNGKRPKGSIWLALVITVALVLLLSSIYNSVRNGQYTKTTYSEFLAAAESGQIREVQIQYDRIIYLTEEEAMKDPSRQKACFTGLPFGGDAMQLSEDLIAMGVETVDTKIVEDNSMIMMILSYVIMIAVIFGVTQDIVSPEPLSHTRTLVVSFEILSAISTLTLSGKRL